MELINVYDFDKTIIPYDSTAAFYKFCARRYPQVLVKSAPSLLHAPRMLTGLAGKTKFKTEMYKFLTALPDVDALLEEFWDIHFDDINDWYLERKSSDDIISSASAEFLLKIPCERLGVRLIASRVDKKTGKTIGLNNSQEEKVRRLQREYPNVIINEFYSDSHHDDPLAKLARRAWFVEGDKLSLWQFK